VVTTLFIPRARLFRHTGSALITNCSMSNRADHGTLPAPMGTCWMASVGSDLISDYHDLEFLCRQCNSVTPGP
jgi:hypothetical protein